MSAQAEALKAQLDIVDVVRGSGVQLRKSGADNYVGLCPFHEENTPSFTVSAAKQVCYCFGCGFGGDVFSYSMQRDGASFPSTVKALAESNGISLPNEAAPSNYPPPITPEERVEGRQLREALCWRLENALELCKLRFWNEGEPPDLAALISQLTGRLREAQDWTERQSVSMLRELNRRIPNLVSACISEGAEFEGCVKTAILAASRGRAA